MGIKNDLETKKKKILCEKKNTLKHPTLIIYISKSYEVEHTLCYNTLRLGIQKRV